MIRILAYGLVWFLLFSTALTNAQEADNNYENAIAAFEKNRYSEAYIHLKNTLQEDPDNLPARLLLAQILFNEGDMLSAEKESDQALMLGADINLVLPVYGAALVLQEKADKLFEIEQVYDSLTPANRFEWALLKGQGYLIKNEPELARAEFEKAKSMFPTDVRATNTLAAVYLAESMFPEASDLIDKSLALAPNNPKTWQLLGELALAQEDHEQALEHFSKAYSLASDDPLVLRSMAQVSMLLGNKVDMQKYLNLILQQSPSDPAATLLSAIMLMDQGEQELGQEMLAELSNKLSRLAEKNSQAGDNFLFVRAAADYIRQSDESAIKLLNAYLARNRGDLSAIRMLTDIYLRNGETSSATQLLVDSKPYITADFGLTLQLLQLYIQTKNTFGAQELLDDIQKVDANNPYVIMLEAEFLRSTGKVQPALDLMNSQNYGGREPVSYTLLRGALQLDLKMESAAQDTAQRLQGGYPDNVRAQNFIAITWLRAGKLSLAETHIEQALLLDPTNVQATFNKAMLARKRGELEESGKIINELLNSHPNHSNAIMLMAHNLIDQGKYQEAIKWSKSVYAYDPSASAPGELQLDIYGELGDWDKALPVALRLTKQHPLNTTYLTRLAQVYMELKDNDAAQRPLHRLYTLWDDDPKRLQELAAMQVETKNLSAARKSLEKALELAPLSFAVNLDLARLLLAEGKAGEAAVAASNLQTAFGERGELSYLQGEAALASGESAVAQRHFRNAFELDRSSAALIQLYQLSLTGVGGTEFTAMLENTLQDSSLPPWAIRMLADSHLAQGNMLAAASYYEGLLGLPEFKNDPELLNNLANIYAEEDLEKALTTATKGLSDKGNNSAALLDTIGWILVKKQHYEQALPYLREAYAINSTDPEIRYHTGVALNALGRTKEAERALRGALATDESFPGRENAQRMIEQLKAP